MWHQYKQFDKEVYRAEPSVLVLKGVHFATVADEASTLLALADTYMTPRQILYETKAFEQLQPGWRAYSYWQHLWLYFLSRIDEGTGDTVRLPARSLPGDWIVAVNQILSTVVRKDPENTGRFKFVGKAEDELPHDSTITKSFLALLRERLLHKRIAENGDPLPEAFFTK